MSGAPSAPASALASAPAELAKGALRRLARAKQEPTPENYARAYAEEAGQSAPNAAATTLPTAVDAKALGGAWVALVDKLSKNLDRGGKQWTQARRKDSCKRVLDGSRSDPDRLLQRLQSLMTAWETDHLDDLVEEAASPPAAAAAAAPSPAAPGADTGAVNAGGTAPALPQAAPADPGGAAVWSPVIGAMELSLRAGLATAEPSTDVLADQLQGVARELASNGISPARVAEVDLICQQARRVFGQRHQLVEALASLCQDLGAGLTELSEDDTWVQGQCAVLQNHLQPVQGAAQAPAPTSPQSAAATSVAAVAADVAIPATSRAAGLSVRGVRAASAVLAQTRQQQKHLRDDRAAARDALKRLIQNMLQEVGELGDHTGRFHQATEKHAQAIANAGTLDSLADVVKTMLADARTVQAAVGASHERLLADRARASDLEVKVQALESELRRLSDEVVTDALTQVANRRGLMQAFDVECARSERAATATAAAGDGDGTTLTKAELAVALIDIDNFKKLNDTLGHAAGDVALKNLATAVRERLRPVDHLARFGGEEFVVLLPGTELNEAQQALTRLQRSLSEALFLHGGREVFVTFSAGVTLWRPGEALTTSLERADEALYEAKRNGKNRTCLA
jgi:diguanylate cyclase